MESANRLVYWEAATLEALNTLERAKEIRANPQTMADIRAYLRERGYRDSEILAELGYTE